MDQFFVDKTPSEPVTLARVLSGHTSPETAFVVDDYPYGFRLRCKIRYWLEFRKGFGFRLMSQTTNPKRPETEVWNKPKGSTYNYIGAMWLDSIGHVHWTGVSEYNLDNLEEYAKTYADALTEPNAAAALDYLRRVQARREAIKNSK
jgi:hypothetical protein